MKDLPLMQNKGAAIDGTSSSRDLSPALSGSSVSASSQHTHHQAELHPLYGGLPQDLGKTIIKNRNAPDIFFDIKSTILCYGFLFRKGK